MTLFPVVKTALVVHGEIAIEIYKISPFDTPNQTLVRGKNLRDHIYDIFVSYDHLVTRF